MPLDLQALRRAVERDRYGLMAYVLVGARPLHAIGLRARSAR